MLLVEARSAQGLLSELMVPWSWSFWESPSPGGLASGLYLGWPGNWAQTAAQFTLQLFGVQPCQAA